ncbi:MAG: hypothetical protein LBL55_07890, partial [Propionibacteriaceae bacterium]|nr:hypothetical protein [Propionibacteriaceae bacterium]
RALVSTGAGLAAVAVYTVYAARVGLLRSTDLRAVAVAMLVFIGVSVVILVVLQVLFHIAFAVRESVSSGDADDRQIDRLLSSEMAEDELDHLIAWKAGRAASLGAGVGLVALLALLAGGAAPALSLHALLWCCAAGSLVEGGLTVWFHQRGVSRD